MASKRTSNGEPRRYFEAAMAQPPTDECMVWPYGCDGRGYGVLVIANREIYVHRLALERSVGPAPKAKPYAIHGPCRTPSCFNPLHLRWGSAAENTRDRERDGTDQRGERNPSVRLSDAQVSEIRRLRSEGDRPIDIAAEFGCSRTHVSAIVNGKVRV